MNKDFYKVTINLRLNNYKKGELTGQKIKPAKRELQVQYKRQYFENGKEVIPAYQEIPDLF
jgi:hypothetical protein